MRIPWRYLSFGSAHCCSVSFAFWHFFVRCFPTKRCCEKQVQCAMDCTAARRHIGECCDEQKPLKVEKHEKRSQRYSHIPFTRFVFDGENQQCTHDEVQNSVYTTMECSPSNPHHPPFKEKHHECNTHKKKHWVNSELPHISPVCKRKVWYI